MTKVNTLVQRIDIVGKPAGFDTLYECEGLVGSRKIVEDNPKGRRKFLADVSFVQELIQAGYTPTNPIEYGIDDWKVPDMKIEALHNAISDLVQATRKEQTRDMEGGATFNSELMEIHAYLTLAFLAARKYKERYEKLVPAMYR